MIAGRIDRQSDNLHVSALELRLYPGHIAELGRTDRREVLRVGKQDSPGIADPVMKAYPTLGRFRLEIRCRLADFH